MAALLQRGRLRVLHLLTAVPILAYFYGPLAGAEWVENVLRFAVLPVLVLSGLAMWQLPRIRAARRRSTKVPSTLEDGPGR